MIPNREENLGRRTSSGISIGILARMIILRQRQCSLKR